MQGYLLLFSGCFQILTIKKKNVMSSNLKMLHVHLWQNEKPLVALYAAVGYNESTANTVLNLKKNDRLYLQVRGDSRAIYNHKDNPYSTFSGYLLSE
jgi:hypothetical protein